MELALSGQLDADDIQTINLFVYESARAICDGDDGSVSGNTSVKVRQLRGLGLASGAVEVKLRSGSYVVHVEAGIASAGGELDNPLAQGCLQLSLDGDRTLELLLHPITSCGDGVLDPGEQCDDSGRECEGCVTVPMWANGVNGFLSGAQERPRAAGDQEVLAACWRSDNSSSSQLPMARYQTDGQDLAEPNPFRQTDDEIARDCHSLAARSGEVVVAYQQDDVDERYESFYISAWTGPTEAPEGTTSQRLGVGDELENAVVAFTDDRAGVVATEVNQTINFYTFRISGGAVPLSSIGVMQTSSPYPQSETALSGSESGRFLIAWIEGDGALLVRAYRPPYNGTPLWHVELCAQSDRCGSPAMAWVRRDGDDHHLIAYRRGRTDGPIEGVWISPDGSMGDAFEISQGARGSEVDVAALGDGFVVVWTQEEGGNRAVFARYLSGEDEFGQMPDGVSPTTDPIRVSPEGRGDCDQPALATPTGAEGVSTFLVFYRDVEGDGGTGSDIARRLLRVIEGS
jgi:hypothetical protein